MATGSLASVPIKMNRRPSGRDGNYQFVCIGRYPSSNLYRHSVSPAKFIRVIHRYPTKHPSTGAVAGR